MTTITVNAAINSGPALAGAAQFNAALGTMRQGVATTQKSLGGLGASLFSLSGLFALAGGAAAGAFVKSMISAADSVALLNARLGLVARDGVEASALFNTIAEAANRARVPATELARIYQRSSNALADMGRSQEQAIRYTETLAKVVKVSGASATEAQAAMLQLTQALVSGRLQGDEFRSVTENLPEVLRILQRESGLTGKELRKLATEGRLSSEMLVNALLNASQDVDQKFAKVPVTVADAWSMLTDQLSRTFGTVANNMGLSKAWADALNEVRASVTSPEMLTGFTTLAGGIKGAAETFRDLLKWIKEATIEYQAWTRAISETTGWQAIKDGYASFVEWREKKFADWKAWKAGFAESITPDVGAGKFATFGNTASTADNAARYAANLRDASAWQTTVINGAKALDVAIGKGKLKVTPGDPDNEDAMRKAQRMLEIMSLQNERQEALNKGDEERARVIENELELRQKISDELRNITPAMRTILQATVAQTNELERQKKIASENRQFAISMTSALTDGIKDAIVAGDKFADTVKKIAIKMIELVVQTAILAPLAKSIANSFSNLMGGSGISNLFGLSPGMGDAGLGSWIPSVTPFAKGGIFNSPVALSAGGSRGVMAEAGPEAIMPLKRGPDGSLGIAASGGGRSGDVHIHIAGDATDATIERFKRVAQQEILQASPRLIKSSVSAVASEHRADPSFLRR